jgi:hypothetical protein
MDGIQVLLDCLRNLLESIDYEVSETDSVVGSFPDLITRLDL